jgi:hypothetical protein
LPVIRIPLILAANWLTFFLLPQLLLHLSRWNGLAVRVRIHLAYSQFPWFVCWVDISFCSSRDHKFRYLSLVKQYFSRCKQEIKKFFSPLMIPMKSTNLTMRLLFFFICWANFFFSRLRTFFIRSSRSSYFVSYFSSVLFRLRKNLQRSCPMMKILPSRSQIHLLKALVALWWAYCFFFLPPRRIFCHAPYLFLCFFLEKRTVFVV